MAATLWPVCVQREYLNDNWVWDYHTKPPEVLLSPDLEDAYFHTDPVDQSTGTAGVRGSKGFLDGEHFWEIIFLEPPAGTSVMVGVGTKKALLHTNNYQYVDLIGEQYVFVFVPTPHKYGNGFVASVCMTRLASIYLHGADWMPIGKHRLFCLWDKNGALLHSSYSTVTYTGHS